MQNVYKCLVNEKRNLIGWQVAKNLVCDDGNSLIDSAIQAPYVHIALLLPFIIFPELIHLLEAFAKTLLLRGIPISQ